MFAKLGEKVSRGISNAYQLGSKAYGYIKPLADKTTKSFKGAYENPIASMAWSGVKQLLPTSVVTGLEGASKLAYEGVGLYNKAGSVYRGYVEPAMAMGRRAVGLGERIVGDVRNKRYGSAIDDVRKGVALGKDIRGLAQKYNADTRANSIEVRKKQSRPANAIPHVSAKKDQARPVQLGSSRPQIKPTPRYRSGRF